MVLKEFVGWFGMKAEKHRSRRSRLLLTRKSRFLAIASENPGEQPIVARRGDWN